MLPDVRDGLTRLERIILVTLAEAEREFPGRAVPTALLYGRVVEQIQVTPVEFQRVLTRLVGAAWRHRVIEPTTARSHGRLGLPRSRPLRDIHDDPFTSSDS